MAGWNERVGNLKMIDTILTNLKLCSIFLLVSFINGVRYLFLKRKLKLRYEEHKEEIHKSIKSDRINFSAFLKEPLETGDDVLDLLLFQIHRSALWFTGLFLFYPVSVIFVYLALLLLKG